MTIREAMRSVKWERGSDEDGEYVNGASNDGAIEVACNLINGAWYSHGGDHCGKARRGPFARLSEAKRAAVGDEISMSRTYEKLGEIGEQIADLGERVRDFHINPTPARMARLREIARDLKRMNDASARANERDYQRRITAG